MTLQQTYESAVAKLDAGDLPAAEAICRRILAEHPRQADAMRLLGLIASRMRKHETAVTLLRRAIAINPNVAEYHNILGVSLAEMGQLPEAVREYHIALQL